MTELSAVETASLVWAGELSAREATAAALSRLDRLDDELRAFREVWPEAALEAADAVDRAVAGGARPPLAGVPIGVKASEGSDSAQVRRLVAAGCVPIGATAVPLPTTPWRTWGHTDRGPTANPWRPDRVPGGSSAGSAAAVAAGIVPLATGADGAGSVRIPAAWCGVVGLKLTNGLVPTRDRGGLVAPGPLVRAVEDAAAYLDAVLHPDATASRAATANREATHSRATWAPTLGYGPGATREQADVAYAAACRLADDGAIRWREVAIRLLDPAPAWHALREASGREASGREASGREAAGRAEQTRRENDRRLAAVFDRVDVLLTPTTPYGPHGHDGPGDRMNVDLTWAFNLSGQPAITVAAGFTPDGLPVGLQIVARHGEERRLLGLAARHAGCTVTAAPGH